MKDCVRIKNIMFHDIWVVCSHVPYLNRTRPHFQSIDLSYFVFRLHTPHCDLPGNRDHNTDVQVIALFDVSYNWKTIFWIKHVNHVAITWK